MALDASIYQNLRPVQPADPMESIGKGLAMGQQIRQVQDEQAMRDAYAQNTGADGRLNQQGFLSDLGRVSPKAAMQYAQQFDKMAKDRAESQNAQMQAAHGILSITQPKMEYLAGMSEADRARAYPQVMQQLEQEGVPMHGVPRDAEGNYVYDKGMFQQHLLTGRGTKEALDNRLTQANINKTQAETAWIPQEKQAALAAAQYGSRSPNAELTSQYDKQAGPIRSSQLAMKQMMDNYNHPSPQGDASLILNAFKIKFPNAPDVNSLEELSKSQAASDQWKQLATHTLEGGLDQGTRDNLMRDGVSTYRANVESLRGIQSKYQARQKQQGVNDPTLTAEPAIDKTFAEAQELQDKIGPYVPPSERGGFMAGVNKSVGKFVGVNSGKGSGKSPDESGNAYADAPGGKMSAQDAQALQWVKSNPADPMAFKIRAKLKAKGLL